MRNFSLKTRENFPLNSKKQSRRQPFILGAFVVLALFFMKPIVQYGGGVLMTPFYGIKSYLETSSGTIPSYFRERSELHARIQSLEQELQKQNGMQQSLDYLEAENSELRSVLGATTTKRIVAGVITRPPYSPYDTFVIDQGSDDGIVQYAPVFYGNNLALGYVEAVFPKYALVTLFSSPHVETTVYIFGPNIFTRAFGDGGGVVRLSIPQGIPVHEGDTVILPSLDTGVLGNISSVISNPTEPEQRAYVTYETPLQSIRLVSVSTEASIERTFLEALAITERMRATLFTVPVPPDFTLIGSTTATTTAPNTATSS